MQISWTSCGLLIYDWEISISERALPVMEYKSINNWFSHIGHNEHWPSGLSPIEQWPMHALLASVYLLVKWCFTRLTPCHAAGSIGYLFTVFFVLFCLQSKCIIISCVDILWSSLSYTLLLMLGLITWQITVPNQPASQRARQTDRQQACRQWHTMLDVRMGWHGI